MKASLISPSFHPPWPTNYKLCFFNSQAFISYYWKSLQVSLPGSSPLLKKLILYSASSGTRYRRTVNINWLYLKCNKYLLIIYYVLRTEKFKSEQERYALTWTYGRIDGWVNASKIDQLPMIQRKDSKWRGKEKLRFWRYEKIRSWRRWLKIFCNIFSPIKQFFYNS